MEIPIPRVMTADQMNQLARMFGLFRREGHPGSNRPPRPRDERKRRRKIQAESRRRNRGR